MLSLRALVCRRVCGPTLRIVDAAIVVAARVCYAHDAVLIQNVVHRQRRTAVVAAHRISLATIIRDADVGVGTHNLRVSVPQVLIRWAAEIDGTLRIVVTAIGRRASGLETPQARLVVFCMHERTGRARERSAQRVGNATIRVDTFRGRADFGAVCGHIARVDGTIRVSSASLIDEAAVGVFTRAGGTNERGSALTVHWRVRCRGTNTGELRTRRIVVAAVAGVAIRLRTRDAVLADLVVRHTRHTRNRRANIVLQTTVVTRAGQTETRIPGLAGRRVIQIAWFTGWTSATLRGRVAAQRIAAASARGTDDGDCFEEPANGADMVVGTRAGIVTALGVGAGRALTDDERDVSLQHTVSLASVHRRIALRVRRTAVGNATHTGRALRAFLTRNVVVRSVARECTADWIILTTFGRQTSDSIVARFTARIVDQVRISGVAAGKAGARRVRVAALRELAQCNRADVVVVHTIRVVSIRLTTLCSTPLVFETTIVKVARIRYAVERRHIGCSVQSCVLVVRILCAEWCRKHA
jgi:hypothetical protein